MPLLPPVRPLLHPTRGSWLAAWLAAGGCGDGAPEPGAGASDETSTLAHGESMTTDAEPTPTVTTAEPTTTDDGDDQTSTTSTTSPEEEPPSCADVAPPTDSLALWLSAGQGLSVEGDRVSAWSDQAGGPDAVAPSSDRRPLLLPEALNGQPVLRFEDGQQVLSRDVPIDGLTELTIAFVNATPELWKADVEWCQHAGCDPNGPLGPRLVEETGCSGTYQKVLWWNGYADWTGVYLTPKQEQIAFRYGNGHTTYSDEPCSIEYDPLVAWKRPASIGAAATQTVAIHEGVNNRLYVHGELVSETSAPEGDPHMYAIDRLDVGNGFGWIDDRNRGGDVAEVLIYTRALADDERLALETYLACKFFPERL